MRQFRTMWLAVIGGLLLIALSVSVAFGAKPIDTEPNRGQQISAFVHDLIFGTDDEPEDDAEQEEEDGDSEDLDGQDADEDAEDEASEDADDVSASAHGACVSEVARDKEAVGGPNENHGGAVSEAARETCWESDEPEEPADETGASGSGGAILVPDDAGEEQDTAGREAAKADRQDAHEAAKADREAAKAERKADRAAGRP